MSYYNQTTSQAERDVDELMTAISRWTEIDSAHDNAKLRALTAMHNALEYQVHGSLTDLLCKDENIGEAVLLYSALNNMQTWGEE